MTRAQAVSGPINPLLDPTREYPFVTLDRKRAALVPPGVEVINFGIGDPREVTQIGHVRTAPRSTQARNPAFDVTPAALVSAIVTERGIARAPYVDSLRKLAAD